MKEVKFLERLAENLLEGGFSLVLKPKLQPVQIAKALSREMESSQVVGANSLLVANRYEAYLHPDDLATILPYRVSVERELAAYLREYAGRRDMKPISPPTVKLLPADPPGRRGRVRVVSEMVDVEPAPAPSARSGEHAHFEGTVEMPVLEARRPQRTPSRLAAYLVDENGRRFDLSNDHTSMGRAIDNDLVVENSGVSRHHARISWDTGRYILIDLDSTNGTYSGSKKISRHALTDGEEVRLGNARLTFHIVAQPEQGATI